MLAQGRKSRKSICWQGKMAEARSFSLPQRFGISVSFLSRFKSQRAPLFVAVTETLFIPLKYAAIVSGEGRGGGRRKGEITIQRDVGKPQGAPVPI